MTGRMETFPVSSGQLLPRREEGKTLQLVRSGVEKNLKLGASPLHQPLVLCLDSLGPHPLTQGLRDDLFERNEVKRGNGALGNEPFRPVRQLFNAMHHAHGQLLMALRTEVLVVPCLTGGEDNPAIAVPVVMILPSSGKTRSCRGIASDLSSEGSPSTSCIRATVEDIGLSFPSDRRMGVGVGDERDPVQAESSSSSRGRTRVLSRRHR